MGWRIRSRRSRTQSWRSILISRFADPIRHVSWQHFNKFIMLVFRSSTWRCVCVCDGCEKSWVVVETLCPDLLRVTPHCVCRSLRSLLTRPLSIPRFASLPYLQKKLLNLSNQVSNKYHVKNMPRTPRRRPWSNAEFPAQLNMGNR